MAASSSFCTFFMRMRLRKDALNEQGSHPDYRYSRHWQTGDVLAQIPLGDYAVKEYGASYLTVHRGDFHALLVEALPDSVMAYGKFSRPKGEDRGNVVVMHFADGTTEEAESSPGPTA
ncbi:Lysophosphatidic acid receptor 4 [Manis javanica]|nr:Lysophosphatidic acid receptor 4 [Manis javanica]